MPWIAGLAFAVTAGLVVLLRWRQVRQLRQDIKDGKKGIDDTWDPYS